MFKPLSTLNNYIKSNSCIDLPKYFTSNQLLTALEYRQNYIESEGNSDILLLDDELANCFGTDIVYKENILHYCRSHIICVNTFETNLLKIKYIEKDLQLQPPTEIITRDPSSLFWLHPFYASIIISKNPYKPLYTWNELCTLFLKFALCNPDHISNLDDSTFAIQPSSTLTSSFKFKYFHKDQIPLILQQITKFIYKPSCIPTVCSNIDFNGEIATNDPIFSFIEEKIQTQNKLIPFTSQWVYI